MEGAVEMWMRERLWPKPRSPSQSGGGWGGAAGVLRQRRVWAVDRTPAPAHRGLGTYSVCVPACESEVWSLSSPREAVPIPVPDPGELVPPSLHSGSQHPPPPSGHHPPTVPDPSRTPWESGDQSLGPAEVRQLLCRHLGGKEAAGSLAAAIVCARQLHNNDQVAVGKINRCQRTSGEAPAGPSGSDDTTEQTRGRGLASGGGSREVREVTGPWSAPSPAPALRTAQAAPRSRRARGQYRHLP